MQRNELSGKMARMLMEGSTPFFALFGSADPDNSSMTIAHIWQSGLGIGDRDYYLDKDQQHIRDEYVKLVAKMLGMSGYSTMANFKGYEAHPRPGDPARPERHRQDRAARPLPDHPQMHTCGVPADDPRPQRAAVPENPEPEG